MGGLGGRRAYLPRTVRSAGLEEMTAAAKAMVRSDGSLSCGCAMLIDEDRRWRVRRKRCCEEYWFRERMYSVAGSVVPSSSITPNLEKANPNLTGSATVFARVKYQ